MITQFTDQHGRDYLLLDSLDIAELPDDGLVAALSVAETSLAAYAAFEASADDVQREDLAALVSVSEQVRDLVLKERNRRYLIDRMVNGRLRGGLDVTHMPQAMKTVGGLN